MSISERRQWYIDNFGSVRAWAVASVVSNWRIRKRLPRITKLAIKQGLIA